MQKLLLIAALLIAGCGATKSGEVVHANVKSKQATSIPGIVHAVYTVKCPQQQESNPYDVVTVDYYGQDFNVLTSQWRKDEYQRSCAFEFGGGTGQTGTNGGGGN